MTQTVAAAGAALLLAPRGKSPRSNLCCQVRAAIKLVSLVTGLHCIISQASKQVGKPMFMPVYTHITDVFGL